MQVLNSAGYSPLAPLFRVCDGVRVRFADNKADSSAVTVLMLSPWPESLWAYRRIWDRVSAVARVVAIDLPGFGHSDGRPELIAPDAMGTFLARLIEEWGLGAPHVVGPDVGTAAALFLAANAPDRVTSLTIGGGAVRVPIDAGGALKDVIEAPSLDVVRGLDARTNIGFAVEPAAGADSEPDVHEDYVSAYDLGRFAESARFVRHYPQQNPVLRDLLPTITTPAQIIAGRDDDLVPWSNNEYLADLLPNSEIHPLDAGHFAWEQASEDYGRLIVDWVTGGFQRLGGRHSLNLRCSSTNCALASSALAPTQVSRPPGPRTCCSPGGQLAPPPRRPSLPGALLAAHSETSAATPKMPVRQQRQGSAVRRAFGPGWLDASTRASVPVCLGRLSYSAIPRRRSFGSGVVLAPPAALCPGCEIYVGQLDRVAVLAAELCADDAAASAVQQVRRPAGVAEPAVAPLHQADDHREEVGAFLRQAVAVPCALPGLLVGLELEESVLDELV